MKEYNVQYQYLMKGNMELLAESEEEAQEIVAGLVLSANPNDLDDVQSDLRITGVDIIRDTVPENEYSLEVI